MAIGVQTDMATPALAKFGSKELRQKFLTPSIKGDYFIRTSFGNSYGLLKGDYVACIGVSEVDAASDVANIKTTATKVNSLRYPPTPLHIGIGR